MAYTYDSDSQVTGLSYAMGETQLGNLTYTYDADGRVTAKAGSLAAVTLPAAVSGNTFNAANELTAFNGAALSYDANGNLTGDGTNTDTWDARNHLSAIGGGATTASFVYDAFGRRMSKSIVTQFLYDGLNPVQELDGGVPPSPTGNLLTGLNIDEYFSRTDTSGAMSFLTDALGSTLALTDSSGSINTIYTYEPFGNTTVSGPSANPYQFTGRENDGTGLYFYRTRYYSPSYQRFIAQDPIGFGGRGVNLYAYGFNDPLYYIDPFGTCPWWVYSISAIVDAGGEIAGNIAGDIAAPESIIGGHLLNRRPSLRAFCWNDFGHWCGRPSRRSVRAKRCFAAYPVPTRTSDI